MSHYFARLAAQVGPAQAAHSATPAAVAPIEQHVEVEAAAFVAAPANGPRPHAAAPSPAPASTTSPAAALQPQAPVPAAVPAQPMATPSGTGHAVALPAQRSASKGEPSAIEATQPTMSQRRAEEPRPMGFVAEAAMPASPASPPRQVDPQVVLASPRVDSAPTQPAVVVASRHEPGPPASAMAIESPRGHAVPRAAPASEPVAVLAPQRVATAPIGSGPTAAAAEAGTPPRTEIRIGTIALEVRAPPAPAPVPRPAPQPAAAPAPAPLRFSAQRHYLRGP